ncbi:hypothetical protein [Sphaerisporangium corydalis]|uniref:Uncharacterized protein n=1 Tax=Sphaerisporangium corydalis TaxID=1441875 RepID=A0ABV9EF29_9ACTN|nr:hypothetical protein [Sphaerisporangium corydalis]
MNFCLSDLVPPLRWSDATGFAQLRDVPGLPDAWWRSVPVSRVFAVLGAEALGELLTELAMEHWPAAAVGDILPALHVMDPDEADEPQVSIALDRVGSWFGLLSLTGRELTDQPFIRARPLVSALFTAVFVRLTPTGDQSGEEDASRPSAAEERPAAAGGRDGRRTGGGRPTAAPEAPVAASRPSAAPGQGRRPSGPPQKADPLPVRPAAPALPKRQRASSIDPGDPLGLAAARMAEAALEQHVPKRQPGATRAGDGAPSRTSMFTPPPRAERSLSSPDAPPFGTRSPSFGTDAPGFGVAPRPFVPEPESFDPPAPFTPDFAAYGTGPRPFTPGGPPVKPEAPDSSGKPGPSAPSGSDEKPAPNDPQSGPAEPEAAAGPSPDAETPGADEAREPTDTTRGPVTAPNRHASREDRPAPDGEDDGEQAREQDGPEARGEEPPAGSGDPGPAEGDVPALIDAAFADLDDKTWAVAQNHVFADAPAAPEELAKLFAVTPEDIVSLEEGLRARLAAWLESADAAPYTEHLEKLPGTLGVAAPKARLMTAAEWHTRELRSLDVPAWQFVLATLPGYSVQEDWLVAGDIAELRERTCALILNADRPPTVARALELVSTLGIHPEVAKEWLEDVPQLRIQSTKKGKGKTAKVDAAEEPGDADGPRSVPTGQLKDVSMTRKCFRHPDGLWWLRVDIAPEQLTGGECPLPSGFASYLGLSPGDSHTVMSAAGEVTLSWQARPVVESLGPLLHDMGAQPGGHLFLTVAEEDKVLRARLVPAATGDLDKGTTALRLSGHTAKGDPESLEETIRVLATRIGMTGPVGLPDLMNRLRERGDRDLLSLMV